MISCYYTIMNRAAFIAKLTEVQLTVEQFLAELQSSAADKFVAHLYQARREYRSARQRRYFFRGSSAGSTKLISWGPTP